MQDNPERARWNARFAAEEYIFGTEPNAFLAAQAPRLRPGMRALSIADGEGRNGVWLARQGLAVTSVDFSPPAQDKARRLAARHGVPLDLVLADLETWDWGPPRFDLVVNIFYQFAEGEERDRMFRHMRDVLRPGGLLMMQAYTPAQLNHRTGGPRDPSHLYTAPQLRAGFADMEILHLAEYEAELDEGPRHKGISAVVDLVARKI